MLTVEEPRLGVDSGTVDSGALAMVDTQGRRLHPLYAVDGDAVTGRKRGSWEMYRGFERS